MKSFFVASTILIFSLFTEAQQNNCSPENSYTEVKFWKNPSVLYTAAKKKLDSFMVVMTQWPGCKAVIISYDASCEECQQYSWDRAFAVRKYLMKKGIDSSRIIFYYGQPDGDPFTASLRFAAEGEDGPDLVPEPIPTISYHLPPGKRKKFSHVH